jgi:ribonuclease PH
MQSNKINISHLRPITYEIIDDQILYAQGLTSVLVKHKTKLKNKESEKLDLSYKPSLKIFYDVSNLADKINHEPYRRGRRHNEIMLFINKTLSNLKLRGDLSVFMVNTDGSSRVTVINAVGLLMAKKQYTSYPLAVSFGSYNGNIKLDLNYIEDSQGEGDCAISFNYGLNIYTVSYILYEGTMTFDDFIKGLYMASDAIISLCNHFNQISSSKE